jgi:iron complex transport system substrate-binding protein
MAGRTVEVSASVDSVIGLGSGGLRLLTYLDAVEMVAGVERFETTTERRPLRPYVHANPSLTDKPPIGSRKSPDRELLLQQDPDVIVWAWAKGGDATNMQNRLGIPVVVVRPGDMNPASRDDFVRSLRFLGDLLDRSGAAEQVRRYMETAIADLDDRTAGVPDDERPSAYVGYLGRGQHGFPYTQPVYPPFDLVNANNVAADATGGVQGKKGAPRVTVDPESIIKWDPSTVFVDGGLESYDALAEPEYAGIEAIETGRIYSLLPTRDYSVNFETVLADAYFVGDVLYPDRFEDVDPVARANEIYDAFVGAPVYGEVADSYGAGFEKLQLGSSEQG